MVEESENLEGGTQLETSGASVASPVEGTLLPITCHKLNSQNYTQWAKWLRIFVQGKGKEEYITVEAKRLEKDEGALKKWKLENSLVMSWLFNTMTIKIGEDFLYFNTTREIWMQHVKLTLM